jgi:hypothetical protein
MPYAFVQDVPANAELYGEIKAILGSTPPDGLIAHIALGREGGLRYVDVWESEAAWEAFRDAKVEPAVAKVLGKYGLPADHSLVQFQQADLIDVWLG